MLLIGSHALNYRLNPTVRKPLDFDVVCTYEEFEEYVKRLPNKRAQYPIQQGKKFVVKFGEAGVEGILEAEIAWPDSSAERMLELASADSKTEHFRTSPFDIPSLNFLYMLKMSHRYLKDSPHFLKTMRDIQVMREHGAFIEEEHEEYFKQRQKDTYTYKHPSLKVSKDNFFKDDEVPYTYDHDSIHEAVKHLEKPAYSYFMRDGAEVSVDLEKFFQLPLQVQLYSVVEESYVLALERAIIPHGRMSNKESFDMALMKVCTSITSGRWREFAWENYDAAQAMYDEGFVEKFWQGVNNGIVQPFKGSKY